MQLDGFDWLAAPTIHSMPGRPPYAAEDLQQDGVEQFFRVWLGFGGKGVAGPRKGKQKCGGGGGGGRSTDGRRAETNSAAQPRQQGGGGGGCEENRVGAIAPPPQFHAVCCSAGSKTVKIFCFYMCRLGCTDSLGSHSL